MIPFNILPFVLGGCKEKEEDEKILCKESWLSEAMPLIRIPPKPEIVTYENIVNDNLLSLVQVGRNDGFGSRIEHQYKLNLNSVTDTDMQSEYRNVFAFNSCQLSYHNVLSLRQLNWDIPSIFGGKPDEEIGAFELKPVAGVIPRWISYYPESLNLEFRLFYFNLVRGEFENFLIPLIRRCVSEEYAVKVLNNYELPDNWEEDFYDLFINSNQINIPVNGGDVIGKADNDVYGTADNNFRLSVLFLEPDVDVDYSEHVETLMKYRGRVPFFPDLLSMAGHPIICQYLNLPVSSSRVDLLDQSMLKDKTNNVLALDPDQHPNGLAYRRLPSATQQNTLIDQGISQQEWETNEFVVYNPDNLQLEIFEANPGDEPLTITPGQASSAEQTIQIIAPSSISTSSIYVTSIAHGSNPLHEILLNSLDCVIVPVKFWKLSLNHIVEDTSYGIPGTRIEKFIPNLDVNALINYTNKILSKQANIYMKWVDNTLPPDPIELTTQSYDEKAGVKQGIYKFDKHNMGHHQEIHTFLNGIASQETNELNVLLTWDLFEPTVGHTTEYLGFPYPYIIIEVVKAIYDQNNNLVGGFTDEFRGRTLAHEFGHWITLRYKNSLSVEEINHFDHTQMPAGHYRYKFNLMAPNTTEKNELITIEQARILNQYSKYIKDSDPHLETE